MTRVLVNGTFDILHIGHLNLLRYAKSFPNAYVYVLIDSDTRIRQLKGPLRPIHNEYERSSLLFNLKSVDRVDVFDSPEELENYIKTYKPDIMIKGDDYKGKQIIGEEYCKEIIFYPRLEKYSTTNIIQRILDNHAGH
jgi:D-beta-D-heptose 7-phosphate kinase/D-beta-D-heptose 1-phosphate adenosyltransferase